MLEANNSSIDHILITHQHRDHTAGIDDLRPIYYLNKKPIDLYAESHVLKAIKKDFQYILDSFLLMTVSLTAINISIDFILLGLYCLSKGRN